MRANSRPHFYRLHDNGWLAVITEGRDGAFAASVGRGGDTARVRRTATQLSDAQRLADAAVPRGHACSSRCTEWFGISDPTAPVEFTATCPKQHSGSLSYTVGDVLLRLNTLSFWCLQCGRSWPATDEQVHHLVARIVGRSD
jgi:hypothetical protein